MKRFILLLLTFVITSNTMDAKLKDLLPRAKFAKKLNTNGFRLSGAIQIGDSSNTLILKEFFTEHGCTIKQNARAKVVVNLTDRIEGTEDYQLAGYENEAYRLTIHPNTIEIKAVSPVGVIRATQTLEMLAEGYSSTPCLEAVDIIDYPAFKLRGFMHDVGRSFISIDELKKQIRLLAHFKVNTFHWHLTENQAWRFEVKAFPQLTASSAMTRFPGQYYTQQQCRDLESYALRYGVKIIPEVDMPGHSEAFVRAMGHSMQTDQGVAELKIILKELVECFPHAPYIHIGGDEQPITYPDFLQTMTNWVRKLGKNAMVWIPNQAGFAQADMVQLWSTAGRLVANIPNIDCRYNYINHFDVFADIVGIYKSNIYYQQKGSPEVAGEICATWNDHKIEGECNILKYNNFYASVIASASRAWQGGGKQYIEQGGTMLPNTGDELEDFSDWETRFLFHKHHCLRNEPIPYVRQTNVRWAIASSLSDNQPIDEQVVTGAGIYLNHTWRKTIPAIYDDKNSNDTAYVWTYVYSPKRQTAGALVELQNYSRSEQDVAPEDGKWDRKGSVIYWNDKELLPPLWTHAGKRVANETPMDNENLTTRPPLILQLYKGWNKVVMVLPNTDADGIRLDKWMFTFVITNKQGTKALPGIKYDPHKGGNTDNHLLPIRH